MTLIPFLIVYYVLLGIILILNLFVIVHVFKYKYLGPKYKYILFVYFFILAFVIGSTHLFILKINWQQEIILPSIPILSEKLAGDLLNAFSQ